MPAVFDWFDSAMVPILRRMAARPTLCFPKASDVEPFVGQSPEGCVSVSPVDRQEFLRIMRAFEQAGLAYVLIGATAMGLQGVLRATEDIDVMVEPSTENLERLRTALRAAYPGDPHVDELKVEDWSGDYAVVRFGPAGSTLYLDLLTRLGETETFNTIEAETMDLDGIQVRLATARALYRLKKDTTRAIDQQDARMIASAFHLNED